MRRRLSPLGIAGLLLGLLATPAALAQTTGSIEGVVRDSSGAPLPGAVIGAWSSNLQGSRAAATGADGRFWLPALPPGTYEVRATVPGFRPERKAVSVTLDSRASVAFSLEQAVEEAVVVSGSPLPVDVTSATGGTTYTSETIARLPIDRNYADIVRLNPAVDSDRAYTQGRVPALTVYGATSAENQWVVDGVNTTSVFQGVQGKAISNEFVQEVEVKTDGYSAEYGRALGGIVNVVTKSGGNAFHGDAFAYYDSSGTSARQKFTPDDSQLADTRIDSYSRRDVGVDLGGFLLKDRLWFFAAFDRVDYSGLVSPLRDTAYVKTSETFPLREADDIYSGKVTWNASSAAMLVATVFADPGEESGAAGADPRGGFPPGGRVVDPPTILNRDPATWDSSRRVGGTDYGLRATQLLGAAVLVTLQGSYHRDRNLLTLPSGADVLRTEDFTCAGGTPDHPCTPPPVANFVTGGHGWIDGQFDRNQSHRAQYRGDTTLFSGAHELKAGGDFEDAHSDMTYAVSGGQLVTVWNPLGKTYYVHLFSAANNGTGYLSQLPDARFRARLRSVGAYLQDSWKAAPGLTVNAGLRWDGEYLQDYRGVTRLRVAKEWQPRLGIVWDPGKNGRTKIYASAGRFFFAMPTVAMTWWFADVTGILSYNFDPVSITPDPAVAAFTPDSLDHQGLGYTTFYGGGPEGTPVDRNLQEMYQDEYTLGFEKLLGQTLTVAVKATYRRLGNAIEDRCDFTADGFGNSCAIINPGSGQAFARGDGSMCADAGACDGPNSSSPPARRVYRGIEVIARKTLGKELWAQASYVYSSLRGNYDGAINEGSLGTVPGRNTDFDFPALWHNAYGRLFLDRPHRLRLDGYWTSPWRVSIGLQAFVESGAPESRLLVFQVYQSPLLYQSPRGSVGRMAAQWEANLTVGYPIAVRGATLVLQGYVYNLFNNQIPLTRSDDATLGSEYGKFTSRQAPRSFRAAAKVSF